MNDSLVKDLAELYVNDVKAFIDNLNEIPEDKLWNAPKHIPNSAGILAQHIAGNLNHYIGKALGKTGYKRNRDAEFRISDKSKSDLIEDLQDVIKMLRTVIPDISEEQLDAPLPVNAPHSRTTRKALLHFYRHLNYHLGQLNYLKRMIANNN